MRIKNIALYHQKMPMHCGNTCALTTGVESADVVVTRIETDTGLVGYGECGCVAGYPAYASAIINGSAELIQNHILGKKPLEINTIQQAMSVIPGQSGALKAGIDIACWDLLGKARQLPLYDLLGGKLQEKVPIYALLSTASPEEMVESLKELREQGQHRFHFRLLHGDIQAHLARIQAIQTEMCAKETCNIDFAGTWRLNEVLQLISQIQNFKNLTLEQPCWTMRDCLSVAERVTCPVKLDDCLNQVSDVLTAYSQQACDSIVLHINRFGGITPIRLGRDLATEGDLKITYSSQWGTEITTAAILHLALTTSPKHLLTAIDAHNYSPQKLTVRESIAVEKDQMWFKDNLPGLSIEVDEHLLGEPIYVIE